MIEQKTILIFTDWYIPGSKAGGPIQSVFNLANLLSEHFIVKVVCRDRDLNSNSPFENIKENKWTEIFPQHFVYYASPEKLNFKLIKQLIKENKSNIIYINGLYSFYFSILPAIFSSVFGVRSVFISVRGMLHKSALSVKRGKKLAFLALAKGYGLYKNFTLLSSNNLESKEIEQIFGGLRIETVSNIPINPNTLQLSVTEFKSNGSILRILFLGRIAPEKNPLTLLKALQLCKQELKVTFCGSGISLEYLKLFERELNSLPTNVQVDTIDEVPHTELQLLFKQHDIMALPSLGENFGHAIFESFAFGLPVIIGNNTPWKNIEKSQAGIEIEPTDANALYKALCFFDNLKPEEYELWSNSAKLLARNTFNEQNFEELYLKLFSKP